MFLNRLYKIHQLKKLFLELIINYVKNEYKYIFRCHKIRNVTFSSSDSPSSSSSSSTSSLSKALSKTDCGKLYMSPYCKNIHYMNKTHTLYFKDKIFCIYYGTILFYQNFRTNGQEDGTMSVEVESSRCNEKRNIITIIIFISWFFANCWPGTPLLCPAASTSCLFLSLFF